MNSYDIFKKLTKGIKFDHKRFKDDFRKLGLEQPSSAVASNTLSLAEQQEEEHTGEHQGGEGGKARSKKKKKKNAQNDPQKQLMLQQQEIRRRRRQLGIQVWGPDVPAPLEKFSQLDTEHSVNSKLVANLEAQGHSVPTPVQAQAWPLMLQRRHILASAPTGSGKTAAFLIPLLQGLGGPRKKGFRAVILAPTRELASQIHRECVRLGEGLGIRAVIIANVSKAKQKYGPQSSQKFGECCVQSSGYLNPELGDLLVTTPNRLVHLLKESVEGPPLSLANVEWLVVDESDRLFEDGQRGFRDQLAAVYQACTGPSVTQALFSATFAQSVQDWCRLNLHNLAMVSVGLRNSASEDVEQHLQFCGSEGGKLHALRDILRKGYEPPVLLFVQSKERAKELFRELIYDNITVDAIHADRTQKQRDNVVAAFREGKIWVLICTELMSRGVDFKGVNLVINYDFPPSAVSYIHRVGRTGRAGRRGQAVTFWTMEDRPRLRRIAQVVQSSGQQVPQWMLDLKKPGRKEKKRQTTQQPERGHVSRAVQHETVEKRRKKQKLEKRKRMKIEGSEAA
ncbi:putative ATP-dependent RNA helicase DDX52 [Chionoecetes opilio]|uniref:Probable ATP-dependent RNA helicase DDX52 n=1 Tax=Chionoecetes opilio TaxID=41210 RepID=A0A8J4XN54_CHIOP|nr:putative ATP-dependent RNA helicase DDX52 [Chionoecetes opilio]